MSTRLDNAALGSLRKNVAVPTYDRPGLMPGIVHLGVGGFHRAHQAMYLDRLLSNGAATRDWAIRGVGVLEADRAMKEALAPQNYLYTLLVKHPDGHREASVVGSIVDYLLVPDDPRTVVEAIASPGTKIVTLTITEGGYNIDRVNGQFDVDHPDVVADLRNPELPRTVFGIVVEALRLRRQRGISPFSILSCDNIQENGNVARSAFGAFGGALEQSFGQWISDEVAFPNSMVDRITPVTTDADRAEVAQRYDIEDRWPVVCEPFTQWVIEDRFTLGRPPWEEAGAQLVADVEPYELMKLRLLNASHQALCYFGYLAGYRYAHEAMADPLIKQFVADYMFNEAVPTLPPVPGVNLVAYCFELLERFANPEIRDTLARLCTDSSDRIPKWLLPVIRHQLTTGGEITRAAAVVASWARYAEGVDEQGKVIDIVDQCAGELRTVAAKNRMDSTAFIANRRLFGNLVDERRFVKEYVRALESLHQQGAVETLRSLIGD